MRVFDAEYLAKACAGEWRNGQASTPVSGFCYDTRTLKPGDLFIAIKTSARDGHDFLDDALAKGAVGALTQEFRVSSRLPQLLVNDTLSGFRSIAARYRQEWTFPVIAITGSCGKTTVKDLLSLLLGGVPEVHATAGNLNNLIGVPATLLALDERSCSFAVVEAGISEPGEMFELAKTIQPDTVVFTAIGPAHLECLEDIDTIAAEKGKLAETVSTRQVYMGPTWKPFKNRIFEGKGILLEEAESTDARWSYRSAFENGGTRIDLSGPGGSESYRIEPVGKGSASNAALAISIARDYGVSTDDVVSRLKDWKPSGLRGEWRICGKARVYLDCYNANPLSMNDALDAFKIMSDPSRPRLYVIGSMEELGEHSERLHERLGRELPVEAEDSVFLLGDGAESISIGMKMSGKNRVNTEIISNVESLRSLLRGFAGDVFLKGSRRYRLEAALEFLNP